MIRSTFLVMTAIQSDVNPDWSHADGNLTGTLPGRLIRKRQGLGRRRKRVRGLRLGRRRKRVRGLRLRIRSGVRATLRTIVCMHICVSCLKRDHSDMKPGTPVFVLAAVLFGLPP